MKYSLIQWESFNIFLLKKNNSLIDKVCVSDATNIVRKALNVIIIAKNTKNQLIAETEYYIDNYCQDSKIERPLFLEMNLPDICNRK